MSDDLQIVSVTKPPKSRRKRRKTSALVDLSVDDLVIENLPSLSEVCCIEPTKWDLHEHIDSDDDCVQITGVTQKKSRKMKSDEVAEVSIIDSLQSNDREKRAKGASQEPELPAYWTSCEKCGSLEKRYHLIEVRPDCQEWFNVCIPLLNENFSVEKLRRIQNSALWHRLQCERQLMRKAGFAGYDLNERLLYHGSRAQTQVICAEGLDQRLGNLGSFGRGIYFSDNPRKCDGYCPQAETKEMFACRVLLGDIKMYPSGKYDKSLVREPPKPSSDSKDGITKTFDSVLGNVHGYNEFVVYNTYRVMPEYVIEYKNVSIPPQIQGILPSSHTARPSVPMCHKCGNLSNSRHCMCNQ